MVAFFSTVVAYGIEGQNLLYSPIPSSSTTSTALNSTIITSTDIAPAVEIFCTQDHCIFGWMSHTWIVFMLMFGLWIGVVCIIGYNYAVSLLLPVLSDSNHNNLS